MHSPAWCARPLAPLVIWGWGSRAVPPAAASHPIPRKRCSKARLRPRMLLLRSAIPAQLRLSPSRLSPTAAEPGHGRTEPPRPAEGSSGITQAFCRLPQHRLVMPRFRHTPLTRARWSRPEVASSSANQRARRLRSNLRARRREGRGAGPGARP